MLRKIAVFTVRFVICLIVLVAVSLLGSGCGTFGTTAESFYGPYGSPYSSYRYNVPIAPLRVGFNRPPAHWNESVFSFRIVNETSRLHVRCVIDGQEHQRTVRGQVMRAYVRTEQGVEVAALIPPGETSYLMFDGEGHDMRCELYGGPVAVGPVGSYIFKKMRERWIRNFTPEQFPDRTYHINDFEVLKYDQI